MLSAGAVIAYSVKVLITTAADNILILFFVFFRENKAEQTIHMKCQDIIPER